MTKAQTPRRAGAAKHEKPLPAALRLSLREVFGVERLREGQEEVIRRVLTEGMSEAV